MKILITGGAGFIGSTLIKHILSSSEDFIINVDKLTYAGNLESLSKILPNEKERLFFEKVDICCSLSIKEVIDRHQPDAIMHLAAESHVDKSIDSPNDFIQTNIVGTYRLLEASRMYFTELSDSKKNIFRFHHISTDEVFGDIGKEDFLFTEKTPYMPSSPYSASKASSDHLVRAWNKTYGLPTIISNCSNNYGPFHFPEKLIPHVIISALRGSKIPIYGDGSQIRDWLFVEDHARALVKILKHGRVSETYNVGGHNQKTNLEVVRKICMLLDNLVPPHKLKIKSYLELLEFVEDRPGHDLKYAIDASKIQNELNWTPKETFDSGILKTVKWYVDNQDWWSKILKDKYSLSRLGINTNE